MKEWSKDYSVNHPMMDKDHQKMVNMINRLHQSMKEGKSKEVLESLIIDLQTYATQHFAREEQYLSSIKYPDLSGQQKQHELFLHQIHDFKNNFEANNTVVAIKMLPFLNEWFMNHIMKIDMQYKD